MSTALLREGHNFLGYAQIKDQSQKGSYVY
jgi:hypothetical protein